VPEAEPSRLTIGYTRVSSALQDREDAYGKASQMRDIMAWSEYSGVRIDRWIHDTMTGATLEREGLAEIREINAQRRLGTLVYARQDRFAREALAAEMLHRELTANGARMVNVQIQLEATPIGNMMRRFLDAFAEMERDLIRERTSKGRIEAVRKNATFMHGSTPLGYRLIPKAECKMRGIPTGSLEIVEDQKDTVVVIFALRERGHGYKAIASYLNEKGARTARGGRFAGTTVMKVIENEAFYRSERVSTRAKTLGMTEEEYAALKPAHPPILPPREPGQDLLINRVRRTLLKDAVVPDDPFAIGPLTRRDRCNVQVLTRDYAEAVVKAYKMRAEEIPLKDVAATLNECGHRTRLGYLFNQTTVLRMERRFHHLLPLAEQALARPEAEEPEAKQATEWSEVIEVIHRMARCGVSRKRSEMSYAKIAKVLNQRFGQTPHGGRFHSETVIRLLRENPVPSDPVRTVAYVRMAKDGTDHLGQIDTVGEWAQNGGMEIAEWYMDRGPALTDNTLPDFQRLRRDAKDGKFGRVAMFALERICQDRDRAREFVRHLGDAAEIFFVSAERTDTPKKPPYVPPRRQASAS
jgi:DNA invertase Pin-like site-specific DNA recombinase